jgi:hypothetical protein
MGRSGKAMPVNGRFGVVSGCLRRLTAITCQANSGYEGEVEQEAERGPLVTIDASF